jgi:hypothetical protein
MSDEDRRTGTAADFARWLYANGYHIARNDRDHPGGVWYSHEVREVSAVLDAYRAGAVTEAAMFTVEPGPERRLTGSLGEQGTAIALRLQCLSCYKSGNGQRSDEGDDMPARRRRAKQLTIRLRADEYDALMAEADEQEVSMADVVRGEIQRVVRKWKRAGAFEPTMTDETEEDERPRKA